MRLTLRYCLAAAAKEDAQYALIGEVSTDANGLKRGSQRSGSNGTNK